MSQNADGIRGDGRFAMLGEQGRFIARRTFLGGAGAAAAGLTFSAGRGVAPAFAQTASNSGIIDVHAHLTPPAYMQEFAPADMAPPSKVWSVAKHLEDMDKAGVATSLLSITSPGIWFNNVEKGRKLSRMVNEYGARLASEHPKKLGLFIALPLPDIEGSLEEIAYGLDVLKADGIGLFTNYGDKWLGDPAFWPVFEEINRRKAVVYTHPLSANCCTNLIPEFPDSGIEFGTDTTRAIAKWVFAGSARKFTDMKIIWSHAGGTMPFLIERFDFNEKFPLQKKAAPDGFRAEAAKFFYDTAQTANPVAMSALRRVIPMSQIVFGTDFPFRTAAEHVRGLEQSKVFTAEELRAVYRDNPLKLLPQFGA